jgi:hypothetical protein
MILRLTPFPSGDEARVRQVLQMKFGMVPVPSPVPGVILPAPCGRRKNDGPRTGPDENEPRTDLWCCR